MRSILALILLTRFVCAAEPEFPLTADSQPQPNVPKGTLLKDNYTAKEGSVFPGTQREYQIYLPAGHDASKPAAFMVFQDGVIYQAPVVFDNLIAKQDIPPLVGIFIKPGVVPAANDNALPRFNRSYEYDSTTPTYSQFLIDEFLPAIEAKHGLKLSTDPNHAAISGNSSGGICAFMAAWHRPDRFRRVFTGVGTYVGIHGADQLPVLVRKFEPKPLRVFLQSGTGDNNLYCGDWWMANQMMERSLTWAGYDVNHAWGEGGHNQKHATQIFPDVLRWLWRDWQTDIEIKANPKGESKWKGYEVVGAGDWNVIQKDFDQVYEITSDAIRSVYAIPVKERGSSVSPWSRKMMGLPAEPVVKSNWTKLPEMQWAQLSGQIVRINVDGTLDGYNDSGTLFGASCATSFDGQLLFGAHASDGIGNTSLKKAIPNGPFDIGIEIASPFGIAVSNQGLILIAASFDLHTLSTDGKIKSISKLKYETENLAFSPDQTQVYGCDAGSNMVSAFQLEKDGSVVNEQSFFELQPDLAGKIYANSLCVDTNGWVYVATSLGIQVCDQAGRVNFIIPTPMQPMSVCFGGKDLSELFIAYDDRIFKRPTKAKGVVSGQQPPIKPAPPKL